LIKSYYIHLTYTEANFLKFFIKNHKYKVTLKMQYVVYWKIINLIWIYFKSTIKKNFYF
jgi:hypothetical protein